MILIDLNQVLIAGITAQFPDKPGVVIDDHAVRHMSLMIVRSHVKNNKHKFGEAVLCSDSKNYWRRDIFPYYKENRKAKRSKSNLDWHIISESVKQMKIDLKENFPYKFVEVDKAEADDIIGILAPRAVAHENVLIISADGDFPQLQRYNNAKYKIQQYNPRTKRFMVDKNPILGLKEKIIRGDSGDGIPNMFSQSDCFMTGVRQKCVYDADMPKFLKDDPTEWTEKIQAGYRRNERLIDLSFIPQTLADSIVNEYETTEKASLKKVFPYLMKHRLRPLIESIHEF